MLDTRSGRVLLFSAEVTVLATASATTCQATSAAQAVSDTKYTYNGVFDVTKTQKATSAILAHLGPTGLHLPATDLWENSQGAFTYTQAAIIAALWMFGRLFS